jgi:hypothetical protein
MSFFHSPLPSPPPFVPSSSLYIFVFLRLSTPFNAGQNMVSVVDRIVNSVILNRIGRSFEISTSLPKLGSKNPGGLVVSGIDRLNPSPFLALIPSSQPYNLV